LLVTNSPSSSFSTITGNSPIVVLVTVMVDRRMYPPLRHFFPSVGVAIDLAVIAGDLHFLADFYVRIVIMRAPVPTSGPKSRVRAGLQPGSSSTAWP
jgi:hypothetical protein